MSTRSLWSMSTRSLPRHEYTLTLNLVSMGLVDRVREGIYKINQAGLTAVRALEAGQPPPPRQERSQPAQRPPRSQATRTPRAHPRTPSASRLSGLQFQRRRPRHAMPALRSASPEPQPSGLPASATAPTPARRSDPATSRRPRSPAPAPARGRSQGTATGTPPPAKRSEHACTAAGHAGASSGPMPAGPRGRGAGGGSGSRAHPVSLNRSSCLEYLEPAERLLSQPAPELGRPQAGSATGAPRSLYDPETWDRAPPLPASSSRVLPPASPTVKRQRTSPPTDER